MKTSGNAPESSSRIEVVSGEGNDSVLALLQWARENDVKVIITVETDAEADLVEAFNATSEQELRVRLENNVAESKMWMATQCRPIPASVI